MEFTKTFTAKVLEFTYDEIAIPSAHHIAFNSTYIKSLRFGENFSTAIVIFCAMSSTIKKPSTDSNKLSSSLMWPFSSNCNFTEWFYNTSESFSEAFDEYLKKVIIDIACCALSSLLFYVWGSSKESFR